MTEAAPRRSESKTTPEFLEGAMRRNPRTIRQRRVEVLRRSATLPVAMKLEEVRPRPQKEAPFSWDTEPALAHARLRAARCPKCATYLIFNSKKNPGDYCYVCGHVWTDKEEEKILHDAHWAKLMRTA